MTKNNSRLIQLNFLSRLGQKNKQSGFTLIEVLVTILVVTGFVLGSLQAVVLATFFRVQAQDKNEALNWVQQDLELIRYEAFMLDRNDDGTYGNSGCPNTYGERLLDDTTNGLLQPSANPRFPGVETPNTPEAQTVSVNARSYDIFREYTPSGNTLQITHTVTYGENHPRGNSSNTQVTTLSTEVIPDAALSC
ncbi:MAG: type IV pilus modification PilV family protein [Cyanobacterium sp.]